jgi:hypothetical protein
MKNSQVRESASPAENRQSFRKRLAAPSLLLAALAMAAPSPSFADQPNLVVNGDFEDPAIDCGLWITVPPGSGFITGWNVNIPSVGDEHGDCDSFPGYSDSVDLLVNSGGGPYVHTLNQAIDMAGTFATPGDSLYQDIPTTPGRVYTLTFFTSSNGGPKQDGLTVEWDEVPIATLSTPVLGTWTENTFAVVATSDVTRLRFVDNLGGGAGSLLDTVSVVEQANTDTQPPVVSCPPALTVPYGSVPQAATSVADFVAQGGSISDQDPNPSVVSSDEVSGSCPTLVTRTYTVTDASGNATQCQQLITVQNLFPTNGIIWFPPLARISAGDTDPSAGLTLKYSFKLGRTIPVRIHALSCDGTDVTGNANVIGQIEVFPVSGCDGVADANALLIDFNGVGGTDGVMNKVDGYLSYNLNTKTFPAGIQCYLIKATVVDVNTGESVSEFLPIQGR